MSLVEAYNAVKTSCVSVPQYPVSFTEPDARFMVRIRFGVNKAFWKSWDDVALVIDAPSPPAQIYFKFYDPNYLAPTYDPLIVVGGYLATCDSPAPGLGISQWLWMAILAYNQRGQAPYPIQQAHIMYNNTNAGSVGLVRYPLSVITG